MWRLCANITLFCLKDLGILILVSTSLDTKGQLCICMYVNICKYIYIQSQVEIPYQNCSPLSGVVLLLPPLKASSGHRLGLSTFS